MLFSNINLNILLVILILFVQFSSGKVFKKCELAKALVRNNVAKEQISNWLCIAQQGSNFNSSAVNLKYKQIGGSAYYGIFQISDQYGCLENSKICGIRDCSKLLNDHLDDDIECMLTIFRAYQDAIGDGFDAWPVFKKKCFDNKINVDDCFHSEVVNVKEYNSYKKKTVAPRISINDIKTGKVYERCELARELRDEFRIPFDQIGTWVCIAKHESNFNTSAIGRLNADGSEDHGLFQISDIYWCSPPGKGWVCGLSCSQLENNDISDDIQCMRKIFAEHQALSGDGFNAWSVYQPYCKGRGNSYIQNCFNDDDNLVTPHSHISSLIPTAQSVGKIYERCELAEDLYHKFGFPLEQIATWVCIAHHESNFNTSAVGRLNSDGSGDHGIFQISDIYWCSPPGRGYACGVTCAELEDSDIWDDIKCVKTIYDEHQRLFGDGFNAWSVYPRCKGQSDTYIQGCNLSSQKQPKPKPAVTSPSVQQYSKLKSKDVGKVYERCELARELRDKHRIPFDQIGTWICIAKHESNFNTSAIGRLNADGSEDHGLFQISDIYWCSPPGKGRVCGLSCSQLENNDISDDIECMRKIFAEHQGLSGDGFNAWSVYQPYCKGKSHSYIQNCFADDEILVTPRPHLPSKTAHVKSVGKIYKPCELAEDLYYKFGFPLEQIATWVCIAHHESTFNTSAIGRLNADGSEDHGLFQISDIYWCSPPGRGHGCGVTCAELEDSDISDDVKCVKTIYDEHQRISGDGFTAWSVYPRCKGYAHSFIKGCNLATNKPLIPKPAITAPTKALITKHKSNNIGKVYERCELARDLRDKHRIPFDQIATWICIAKHESNFNTSAIGRLNADGSEDHGLFQISDIYWCSPPGKGWVCGLSCAQFENNDISDDIECMRKIFAEHQGLSGDGFNAWSVYQPYCKGKSNSYIQNCFDDDKNTISPVPHSPSRITQSKSIGKIYKKCELAEDLYYKFGFPLEQIPTWICIAQHESNFNTSAIGRLNADGSEDHGLFQISDIYWCSPPGRGHGCGLTCAELEDSDISDDVKCVKTIYDEHQRLFGDGFNAWTVYPRCKGKAANFIGDCNLTSKKLTIAKPSTPFVNKKPNQPIRKPQGVGKVYNQCELARELRDRHGIPFDQIGTWVCIAKHESNFNTSAIGRLNADGSGDHGLFQISDIYWCSPPGNGWVCGLSCSELENNDISDDIECMRKIFDEHQKLSGDGFNAWSVYKPYCKGKSNSYIQNCFSDDENLVTLETPSRKTSATTLLNPVGKIYRRCELAEDLYYKFSMPLNQISTWVCIAHYESGYNTSAIGRLNADGSGDHGIFQISDIYWCSPPGRGYACGVSCAEMEDSDISDDVKCVKTIYDEHQRLSGDGFNAWTVYPRCKGQAASFIQGCNLASKNPLIPKPAITAPAPTKSSYPKHKTKSSGKIFEKCELARELRDVHRIPKDQIPIWVCIAQQESNFNTALVGYPDANGSRGHGMFLISDAFWCSTSEPGKHCEVACTKLEDNNITDDVNCVKEIIKDTENWHASKNGFNAWSSYQRYCKSRSETYLNDCNFKSQIATDLQKIKSKGTGKIYDRCELAKELRNKHGIPQHQIPIWVCIAQRASNLNTAAIGTGEEDHGLFQISQNYWCSPPGNGKGCNIACDLLRDNDISDDVECVQKIYEEHQLISGDGFKAWTAYETYCKYNARTYTENCLQSQSIPTTTQRSTTTTKKLIHTTSLKNNVYQSTTTSKLPATTTKSSRIRTTRPQPTTTVLPKTTAYMHSFFTTIKPKYSTAKTVTTPKTTLALTRSKRTTITSSKNKPTTAQWTKPTKAQKPTRKDSPIYYISQIKKSKTTPKTLNIFDFYLNLYGKQPQISTLKPFLFEPFSQNKVVSTTPFNPFSIRMVSTTKVSSNRQTPKGTIRTKIKDELKKSIIDQYSSTNVDTRTNKIKRSTLEPDSKTSSAHYPSFKQVATSTVPTTLEKPVTPKYNNFSWFFGKKN